MNAKGEKIAGYDIPEEYVGAEQRQAVENVGRICDGFLLSGEGVRGNELKTWKERTAEADKKYRELVGDTAFSKFKADYALEESNREENFMRILQSKMAHSDRAERDAEYENDMMALAESDCVASGAAIAQQSVKSSIATENMKNADEVLITTKEGAEEQVNKDESLSDDAKKDAINEIELISANARGTTAAIGLKEIAGASTLRTTQAVSQIESLRKAVDKCFFKELVYSKSMTKNDVIANANAMAKARNFAKSYFTERLARGNIHEVMTMLTEIQKFSDAEYKKTKEFNPRNMVFCRPSDFKDIHKAALAALDEAKRRENAEVAATDAARKRKDDILMRKADTLEFNFKKYYSTILDKDVDPMASIPKYITEIDALKQEGYKDAGALYDKLMSAAQQVNTIRDSAEKRTTERTAQENLIDYETQYETYKASSADGVFLSFLTPNGTVQQNEKTGNTERRAALVAHAKSMLKNCSDALTEGQKQSLRADIEDFSKEKVDNDCKILQRLAHDIGFELPQMQTRNVFTYRQMAYQEVEGMPSKQTSSEVLFHKDGLVLMGNEMTVAWRDGKGNRWELGKNEAQQIFRRMFHIISQTPADEMRDPKAYDKLKREFSGVCQSAARDKDANNRMSKLASQFDKLETGILGVGGSKSLSFITRNYRTPQQHAREIYWRNRAEEWNRSPLMSKDFAKPVATGK